MVLTAGAVVAACGGTATVASWVSATGFGSHVGTLQADNARIDADVARVPPAPALRADCSLLVADLSAVAGDLPTPDERLTSVLDAAYHADAASAADCTAGVGGDPAAMARSNVERRQAEHGLVAAMARILSITGSVPPTSTTTAAGGGLFG